MTEERDPKVSKRYRGLGREEPPRDLDERILAASRRPASAGRYRWAGPLAAAAVLVLAVGVALHVEREEPKETVARVDAPKPAQPAAAPPAAFTPDPKPKEPSREMRARPESRAAPPPRMEDARRERVPDELAQKREQPAPGAPAASDEANAAAAVAAASEARAQAEVAARRDAQTGSRAAQAAPPAPVAALAKAQQSPEQWLDRISQLRRDGKHDEADRQLAEFRRAYPDYRLSEEMKAKVEKRQ